MTSSQAPHPLCGGTIDSPCFRSGEPRWDRPETLRRLDRILEEHGPWTAHNIDLGHGVKTIDASSGDFKLRRVLQIVADAAGTPISGLRVLDLGCLEGLYSIEFARRGAEVVGIEGRRSNLAKAEFARDAWNLRTLTLLQQDVRELSRERHGTFDVVLCLGILYHLDAPDVFHFVRRMADVCRRLLVVDTHISLVEERTETFDGNHFTGRSYREHDEHSSSEERRRGPWAALDNTLSFWMTRTSLVALLSRAGFTSLYECHAPEEPIKPTDRLTLLGFRGTPALQNRQFREIG